MKITLRKANALQQAVNDAMASLDLSTEVSINEFQNPGVVLEIANEAFTNNLTRRNNLIDALFAIRKEVAAVNATSGVNDTLALVANLDKKTGTYVRVSKISPVTDREIIIGKLGKIKGRDAGSDPYGYSRDATDHVRTTIFTEDEIESFGKTLKGIKREKQLLQDKLLELNVQNEITLDSNVVGILTSEELI